MACTWPSCAEQKKVVDFSRSLSVYTPHAAGLADAPSNQSRASERIAGRSLRANRRNVFGGSRAALPRVAAFAAARCRIARWWRRSGLHPGAADDPPESGARAGDLFAALADGRRVVHGARLLPQ